MTPLQILNRLLGEKDKGDVIKVCAGLVVMCNSVQIELQVQNDTEQVRLMDMMIENMKESLSLNEIPPDVIESVELAIALLESMDTLTDSERN